MRTTTLTGPLKAFIERIPKAELHIHLEGGAMYPSTALTLAERNGMKMPFHDEASAEVYYQFSGLDEFIEILRTTVSTLNTAADYQTVTEVIGEAAAKQNIWYHEIFFTWGLVSPRGVTWEDIVEGITEGRRINRERHGVETRFIADIDRTQDADTGLQMVELAAACPKETGIVGVGLDCQERGYPASRHILGFNRAKELGLHLVAHAGEDAGPESVWDAIENLDVNRIDHGVRAIEDPNLVRLLAERRIPLTTCPVSNIALKVFPDMASHSLKALMDAGCFVTVNSDDPPMFQTDMTHDLCAVAETFDFGVETIEDLARNSFLATFMEENEKSDCLKRFDSKVTALKAELFG
jgi:adenosine deaminase